MGYKVMDGSGSWFNPLGKTGHIMSLTGFQCAVDCLTAFNVSIYPNTTDGVVITHDSSTLECSLYTRYLYLGVPESTSVGVISVFIKGKVGELFFSGKGGGCDFMTEI